MEDALIMYINIVYFTTLILLIRLLLWGHAVSQFVEALRYKRKVAGSIPDGVIGIFHLRNRSGRTMALGSTQPLTEISSRIISWGVKAAVAYG
jgi:hypothetical protein